MEVAALVLGVALAAVALTFAMSRILGRRMKGDPEAMRRVRLTPQGAGWIYEYGWPRRRRASDDPPVKPDAP